MSKRRGPVTHGMSYTHVYCVYHDMISRCTNSKSSGFVNYGGRGIVICRRWLSSFLNFLEDMHEPRDGETLERINNNGPYSPRNCRWATRKEQARNSRRAVKITTNGKTQVAMDWSLALGGSDSLVRQRLKKGWNTEEAVTTPIYGKYHGNRKGENNSLAKLTENQIRNIRQEREQGASLKELAKKYNIDKVHVWNICARKRWGHIK